MRDDHSVGRVPCCGSSSADRIRVELHPQKDHLCTEFLKNWRAQVRAEPSCDSSVLNN